MTLSDLSVKEMEGWQQKNGGRGYVISFFSCCSSKELRDAHKILTFLSPLVYPHNNIVRKVRLRRHVSSMAT